MARLTELPIRQLLAWAGVHKGRFHDWRKRYGKVNEHNGLIPRDHWLDEWEQQAILDYHDANPLNGYRRLTFMMLDAGIVAAAPSTVYRVLKAHRRLDRWIPGRRARGQASRSHRGHIGTGTSTSHTSTSARRSRYCLPVRDLE